MLLALTACKTDNKSSETEKNSIIFATTPDYPPFEFYKNGELTGFDIELATEIAKRLQLKCEFLEVPFMSILASLESGKADAAISTISVNDERAKKYDFSTQYYKEKLFLIVDEKLFETITTGIQANDSNKTDSDENSMSTDAATVDGKSATIDGKSVTVDSKSVTVDSKSATIIAQLQHKKIACQLGTTMEMWLKIHGKGVEICTVDSNNNAIELLKSQRVDAVLLDSMQAKEFVKNNATLKYIEFTQADNGYAIAFAKNNSYREKINIILTELEQEGFLDKLKTAWLISKNT